MVFRNTHSGHRHWLALGVRAWVLAVLLLGSLVSSLGHASSHGLSALATVQHDADIAHGHSHEDEEPNGLVANGDAGHIHHNNADHSHDKAHALPQALWVAALNAPVWRSLAHALACGRTVACIERPPMA